MSRNFRGLTVKGSPLAVARTGRGLSVFLSLLGSIESRHFQPVDFKWKQTLSLLLVVSDQKGIDEERYGKRKRAG